MRQKHVTHKSEICSINSHRCQQIASRFTINFNETRSRAARLSLGDCTAAADVITWPANIFRVVNCAIDERQMSRNFCLSDTFKRGLIHQAGSVAPARSISSRLFCWFLSILTENCDSGCRKCLHGFSWWCRVPFLERLLASFCRQIERRLDYRKNLTGICHSYRKPNKRQFSHF